MFLLYPCEQRLSPTLCIDKTYSFIENGYYINANLSIYNRQYFKKPYEKTMKTAKLIVMYPTPADVDSLEQRYAQEHVPMAVEKLAGKTRFVASPVTSSPGNMS